MQVEGERSIISVQTAKQLYYTHYIDRVALVCEVGRTRTFLFRFFYQILCQICSIVLRLTIALKQHKAKKNMKKASNRREHKGDEK